MVLEIVLADQVPTIVASAQALTVWHQQISKPAYAHAADYDRLRTVTLDMLTKLRPFAAVDISLKTPKLHRVLDYPEVIRAFGGARHVTTDMYEMAHKKLKAVLARYVVMDVLNPALWMCARTTVVRLTCRAA